MKWILAFGILFSVSLTAPVEAQTFKVLEDWTVELAEPEIALEYPYQFFVGGLSGRDGYFYVASANGMVSKRSLLSGESVWRQKLQGDSQSRWTYSDGRLFGGDSEGVLYSLDAETGEILWRVENKGVYFSAPLVKDGSLWVINSFGDLESYSAEDGTWRWQQKDPESIRIGLWGEQGPQFFGEQVIAGFPSGLLQAFDASSGAKAWSSNFKSVVGDTMGLNDLRSFSTHSEYLVASSFTGNTRAWQLVGGSKKQLWEKRLSIPQAVSFSLSGDKFYASDREGRLSCFDTQTGFIEWQAQLPGGVGNQPTVTDNYIWVATSEGFVLVFDHSGNEVSRSKDLQTAFYNQGLAVNEDTVLILSSRGILRRMQVMKVSSGETPSLKHILRIF